MPVSPTRLSLAKVSGRPPFTLIELLVVTVIITILISMVLPALKGAKESAARGVCAGNMRQIGIADYTYETDFDGWNVAIHEDRGCTQPRYAVAYSRALVPTWESYWNREIRQCPKVRVNNKPSEVPEWYGANAGRLALNCAFTYARPALDMVGAYWYRRGTYVVGTDSYASYVKRMMTGLAGDGHPWRADWAPYPWEPAGVLPLAADSIFGLYLSSESQELSVTAHTGTHGQNEGWVVPRGGNSLWNDLHVQWNDWEAGGLFSYPAFDYQTGPLTYGWHTFGSGIGKHFFWIEP